uniref:Nuclear receptor domain-containing protein n=1 Tax=Steinernema glaseri TaxID=37863 RepID=A0A1I7XZH1_9BILA
MQLLVSVIYDGLFTPYANSSDEGSENSFVTGSKVDRCPCVGLQTQLCLFSFCSREGYPLKRGDKRTEALRVFTRGRSIPLFSYDSACTSKANTDSRVVVLRTLASIRRLFWQMISIPGMLEQPGTSTTLDFRELSRQTVLKFTREHTPTVCLVCGEAASCCHYGVASCGRCKSFFRRYVLGGRRGACTKGNGCDTGGGGKMCPHCRFRKCITLGMRPEAVNSAFKKANPENSVVSKESRFEVDLAALTDVENRIKKMLYSTYFPYSKTKTASDYLKEDCHLKHADKYEDVPVWRKPPPGFAFTADSVKEGYKMWGFMKAVFAVEFYKTFNFFRRLSFEDQLALVRATVISVGVFHQAYNSYMRGNREHRIDPDGTIPYQGLLKDSPAVCAVRHSHILAACVRTRITPEKALLLKTIIALNSAAPSLSEEARVMIEEERLKYVKTLMKIVQLEAPFAEWIPRFQQLYDMVNLNLRETQNMVHFYVLEVLPLQAKGIFPEQLWLDVYKGAKSSFSALLTNRPE